VNGTERLIKRKSLLRRRVLDTLLSSRVVAKMIIPLKQLYDRYNNNSFHSQRGKGNQDKENQQQKQKKQQLRLYHFSRHLSDETVKTDTLCNTAYLVDWSVPFEIFSANELATAATAIVERKEEEEAKRDNRQLVCKK
jgi:hypothetical protein